MQILKFDSRIEILTWRRNRWEDSQELILPLSPHPKLQLLLAKSFSFSGTNNALCDVGTKHNKGWGASSLLHGTCISQPKAWWESLVNAVFHGREDALDCEEHQRKDAVGYNQRIPGIVKCIFLSKMLSVKCSCKNLWYMVVHQHLLGK